MQPLVGGGPCVDDFIGVEMFWSAAPKTVQGYALERGSPSGWLHCNHDNQWLVLAGPWGWGRGEGGGGTKGATRCPVPPNESH